MLTRLIFGKEPLSDGVVVPEEPPAGDDNRVCGRGRLSWICHSTAESFTSGMSYLRLVYLFSLNKEQSIPR